MRLRYYHVDAFTTEPFRGNPAGVCPLEKWLPDETLRRIAAENNLSETAFFIREKDFFHLRWFTPEIEVDLCGHATLATAMVISSELGHPRPTIVFTTLTGRLAAAKPGTSIAL